MNAPRLLTVVVTILLVATGQRVAAGERLTSEEIDRFATPLIDGEWCPGFVVGVLDESGPRMFGYGRTSETNAAAPGADTIFEIGSVTKTFTGVLLAEMAGRGEVALDGPVQKYLPDTVKMPQIGDKPITLAHLATHRSGLPRLPDNMSPADPTNPYADYTVEQMYAFVNGCKPRREPGVAYEYSNLGMGLLGHVLARRAGKDYETLVTERILRPLKMNDTRIALDDAAKARLAQGHDADNVPVKNWDLPTLAGAGAIRSTPADLLKWADATSQPPAGPLGEAIKLARTARERSAGDDGPPVGLGWHVSRTNGVVSHGGQTGGYHTYVALSPERRLAVVICASNGSPYTDQMGERLSRRLADEETKPLELPKVTKLTSDQLDALPGRYVMPLHVLTLTREGDRLWAKLDGQPRFGVYAESPTELFYKAVDARLSFKLNKKTGRAFMVTLKQGPLTLPGLRAEGEPTTLPAGE